MAYAARHPDRVSRLILYDSYSCGAYTDGAPKQSAKQARVLSEMIKIGWDSEAGAFREVFANLLMPEGSRNELHWIAGLERRSVSAESACRLWNAFNSFDVRADAAKITTPTLVFHVRGDAMVPFEAGRRLAAMIPNARFIPLDGKNHILLPNEKAWEVFRNEFTDFLNADEDRFHLHPSQAAWEAAAGPKAFAAKPRSGHLRIGNSVRISYGRVRNAG